MSDEPHVEILRPPLADSGWQTVLFWKEAVHCHRFPLIGRSSARGSFLGERLLARVTEFFFAVIWAEARCRFAQSCLNSSMVSRPCFGLFKIWLARVRSNS